MEVIRGRWRPNPMPEWVTCVPSTSHPGMNEAFAERLASLLALPYAACLTAARGEPQARMQNSAQQAGEREGNAWASTAARSAMARSCSWTTSSIPAGP